MNRLIVLRPEPGASSTVERAREMGLEAVALPLFAVEPLAWNAPDPGNFDALLLTSANAVRHGGEKLQHYRGLRAFCVGQATADAARQAGFDIASVGKAGVARLLGSIERGQRLLHLAGEDRAAVGPALQEVTAVTVYRSKALPAPTELHGAEGAVVLVHSPRAGRRLAEVTDELGLNRARILVAAISTTARDAAGCGWAALEISDTPDDPSLLALARSMCDKPC